MLEPDLSTLTTEARNPRTRDLDAMAPLQLAQAMHREDAAAVAAVEAVLPTVAAAIEAIAARMQRGGRLIYIGAGTSGRLGVLDAVECRPTFSAPEGLVVGVIAGGEPALVRAAEGIEDRAADGAADVARLDLTAQDTVVGIAASGRTPYVVGALVHARAAGSLCVALVCNAGSAVAAAADLAIEPVVGAEALTGSTRLKAGTATKLVLNMLSTGVMASLGKCYENLMVDVQATNDKLRARAKRIVAQATSLPAERAAALLSQCQGEVKTAIVAGLGGVTAEVARTALVAQGHSVRRALATLRASG